MKRFVLFLFGLVLLLSVSCSGNEFSVSEITSNVYVSKITREMGLCVYARTDSTKDEKVSFEISNPDGNLTWTVNATKEIFDGNTYYGTSEVRMPASAMLDKGKWKVTVISDDGSSEDFYFDVDYSYTRDDDVTGLSSGKFSTKYNLTVIDL